MAWLSCCSLAHVPDYQACSILDLLLLTNTCAVLVLLLLLQMHERTVYDYQACLDQLLTWRPLCCPAAAAAAAADA
jgi:hypothetical protein